MNHLASCTWVYLCLRLIGSLNSVVRSLPPHRNSIFWQVIIIMLFKLCLSIYSLLDFVSVMGSIFSLLNFTRKACWEKFPKGTRDRNSGRLFLEMIRDHSLYGLWIKAQATYEVKLVHRNSILHWYLLRRTKGSSTLSYISVEITTSDMSDLIPVTRNFESYNANQVSDANWNLDDLQWVRFPAGSRHSCATYSLYTDLMFTPKVSVLLLPLQGAQLGKG